MLRSLTLLVVALGGLYSAQAAGEGVDGAAMISLRWSKFCLQGAEPGTQVCFTGQTLAACERPLVSVTLYEDATLKRLSIRLRQAVSMERGVRIAIDRQQPVVSGSFLQGDADGCLAQYEAGPKLMSQLKGGRVLAVEASDAAGQPVKFELSLDRIRRRIFSTRAARHGRAIKTLAGMAGDADARSPRARRWSCRRERLSGRAMSA